MPPSSKLIFKQVLKTDWCYKNEARGKKKLEIISNCQQEETYEAHFKDRREG